MSNKTISINPSLFSVGSSKTKKKREKKSNATTVPIISPNVLKNKLLKRIKEHKQRETSNLDNNKRKLEPNIDDINSSIKSNDEIVNFNDEFNDSINYLQTLSKQNEKMKYETVKQKRKEEIERRTIRNYHLDDSQKTNNPIINIDLPDELKPTPPPNPIITEPYRINTQKNEDVPYGILKGGFKPCYREWAKTQRNNVVTNPNASLIIQGGNISSEQTARENRLKLLKEKIKQKNQVKTETILLSENLINKPIESNGDAIIVNTENKQPSVIPTIENKIQENKIQESKIQENKIQENEQIIATKHITKKTIKRKYILGRSKTKQKIGVLIKDRVTRKNILNAQKDLKKKNINDIKSYLKDHNLIKIGSNAPNDVIRKLYESSMLAGEITNKNSDNLLHNFTKEDKQL